MKNEERNNHKSLKEYYDDMINYFKNIIQNIKLFIKKHYYQIKQYLKKDDTKKLLIIICILFFLIILIHFLNDNYSKNIQQKGGDVKDAITDSELSNKSVSKQPIPEDKKQQKLEKKQENIKNKMEKQKIKSEQKISSRQEKAMKAEQKAKQKHVANRAPKQYLQGVQNEIKKSFQTMGKMIQPLAIGVTALTGPPIAATTKGVSDLKELFLEIDSLDKNVIKELNN
jgi:hypothetical protein